MSEQHHTGDGDNIHVDGDAYFNVVQKHPSLIADIVNALYPQIADVDEDETFSDFKIDQKIEHNQVVKYKALITENALYQSHLMGIYTEYERQGEFRMTLFLKYIRNKYLRIRGEFEQASQGKAVIEVVKANADSIIDKIRNEMSAELLKSKNFNGTTEAAAVALDAIVVDAFMRCKILEKPPVQ